MAIMKISPQKALERMDDLELTHRIVAGDKDALRYFFDMYIERLYEFVLTRSGNDVHTTDEIVQDTCLVALEGLSRFRGESKLYTWLCGIALNKLRAFWRQRPREDRRMSEQEIDAFVGRLEVQHLTERELQGNQTDDMVSRVLSSLQPHYQDALWLKYVDGLSIEEMATKLEMSDKAVGSLLVRARESFKQSFRQVLKEEELA